MEPEVEKSEYDLHNNTITDLGYQQFLSRAINPICEHFGISFKPTQKWFETLANNHRKTPLRPSYTANQSIESLQGIDIGCGVTPVLALQLNSLGFTMAVYDKYFADYPDNMTQTYDLIVSTETIEHIWEAKQTWAKWVSCLKDNGVMVIMTKRVTSKEAFAKWHYIHDPTHICFYSEVTARYLADLHKLDVAFYSNDIMLFTRQK